MSGINLDAGSTMMNNADIRLLTWSQHLNEKYRQTLLREQQIIENNFKL